MSARRPLLRPHGNRGKQREAAIRARLLAPHKEAWRADAGMRNLRDGIDVGRLHASNKPRRTSVAEELIEIVQAETDG